MASPYFNFGNEDETSRFMDLFSRFQSQQPEYFGQYLDPSDPEFQRYQQLAASPTGSEELISDYVGRRPSYEDYSPGTGRKLAAFLIGSLSGNPERAYTMAQKHLYAPYEQELADWKGEGTGITARARLMDAERARELGSLKYGLQQKSSVARAKAGDIFKRDQESRRLANEVQQEEQWKENQSRMEENETWKRGMAEALFDMRKEGMDWRKYMDLERRSDAEDREKRLTEEKAERDRIRQEGAAKRRIEAEDNAKELAFRKASQHPAFRDLVEFDPNNEVWLFTDPNSERTRQLKIYLQNLINKYAQGEIE